MAYDYREQLSGDPKGLPDLELQLATDYPPGVLESYHVSLDAFRNTLDEVLATATPDSYRESLEAALHRVIAGTAMYAYNIGVAAEREKA